MTAEEIYAHFMRAPLGAPCFEYWSKTGKIRTLYRKTHYTFYWGGENGLVWMITINDIRGWLHIFKVDKLTYRLVGDVKEVPEDLLWE